MLFHKLIFRSKLQWFIKLTRTYEIELESLHKTIHSSLNAFDQRLFDNSLTHFSMYQIVLKKGQSKKPFLLS